MSLKIITDNQLNDCVAVIMGTRPGIIKMAPIVKELTRNGIYNEIIHTGQHYSENMDKAFFHAMELPIPRYRVDKTKDYSTHAEQTAEMLRGVESVLFEIKPKIVLVCGDANTNLAAGLAARKLGIIVGHVESGLRSHDWSMPEEHNRIILDHLCELLFAPTKECCTNLVMDNVRGEIWLTGNSIVDATLEAKAIAKGKRIKVEDFGVEPNGYALVTSHREENVDHPDRLKNILEGLRLAMLKTGLRAIFPMHPRTRKRLVEFGMMEGLLLADWIELIDPLEYLEFNTLIRDAALVMTDSGGVQEESCILHTPCVTLRDNTERPETISVGSNLLAGTTPNRIAEAAIEMKNLNHVWTIPFGDGKTSKRIVEVVMDVFKRGARLKDISKFMRSEHDEVFELMEVKE